MPSTTIPHWTAGMLRRDLSARAQSMARSHGLLHDLSPGNTPAVVFGCDEQGRHGNFEPLAWAAIRADLEWSQRLAKVHTASRRSRARKDWRWMELDSATSSDALLMNVFCHPGVFDGSRLTPPVAALLNVAADTRPRFGAHPGVPLQPNRASRTLHDRTEVDLTLADLFVEAKLTESDFQAAPLKKLARYRDLEAVFEVDRLPRKRTRPPVPVEDDEIWLNVARKALVERLEGYQLIRNVLAAYAAGAAFCVLCDARRKDLIEIWFAVLSAVHAPDFAWRLKLLTWQELAAVLPPDLQQFLAAKYGIES